MLTMVIKVVSLRRYRGLTYSLLRDPNDHIAGAEEIATCMGHTGHVHLDCTVPCWFD